MGNVNVTTVCREIRMSKCLFLNGFILVSLLDNSGTFMYPIHND